MLSRVKLFCRRAGRPRRRGRGEVLCGGSGCREAFGSRAQEQERERGGVRDRRVTSRDSNEVNLHGHSARQKHRVRVDTLALLHHQHILSRCSAYVVDNIREEAQWVQFCCLIITL